MVEICPTGIQNFTFLAEVAGGHGFVEPLLDLMIDELHKGIVLGRENVIIITITTISIYMNIFEYSLPTPPTQ